MRWIKLLAAIISARFRSRLSPDGVSEIDFRVWLTDVDASIMNHAEIMTVFETGRIDFMVRTGFFRLARKNQWHFPSRSITAQFIRPLKLFQKARLTSKILHMDDKWIYTEQRITRGDKLISVCMVKSTVKQGRETLSPLEIADELGFTTVPQDGEGIAQAMARYDDLTYQRLADPEQ